MKVKGLYNRYIYSNYKPPPCFVWEIVLKTPPPSFFCVYSAGVRILLFFHPRCFPVGNPFCFRQILIR
jgi:hypothetical protein